MKLFKLFKRKEQIELGYDSEDFKKIKKKDRKKTLRLLEEYKQGLIIQVDRDINQNQLMEELRKNEQVSR